MKLSTLYQLNAHCIRKVTHANPSLSDINRESFLHSAKVMDEFADMVLQPELQESATPRTEKAISLGWLTLCNESATLERELAEAKVPICIGRPIIQILAKDGQWASEDGIRSVVAADCLFHKDPYATIERLTKERDEARSDTLLVERDSLRQQLADSESIRHAEKKMLLKEIEDHTATKQQLADAQRERDELKSDIDFLIKTGRPGSVAAQKLRADLARERAQTARLREFIEGIVKHGIDGGGIGRSGCYHPGQAKRFLESLSSTSDPGMIDKEDEATTGAKLIAAERLRQINEEGYSTDHDDNHKDGSLAQAACAYAMPTSIAVTFRGGSDADLDFSLLVWPRHFWPWEKDGFNRSMIQGRELDLETRIDECVKAGALLAAEIERLQRLLAKCTESLAPEDKP